MNMYVMIDLNKRKVFFVFSKVTVRTGNLVYKLSDSINILLNVSFIKPYVMIKYDIKSNTLSFNDFSNDENFFAQSKNGFVLTAKTSSIIFSNFSDRFKLNEFQKNEYTLSVAKNNDLIFTEVIPKIFPSKEIKQNLLSSKVEISEEKNKLRTSSFDDLKKYHTSINKSFFDIDMLMKRTNCPNVPHPYINSVNISSLDNFCEQTPSSKLLLPKKVTVSDICLLSIESSRSETYAINCSNNRLLIFYPYYLSYRNKFEDEDLSTAGDDKEFTQFIEDTIPDFIKRICKIDTGSVILHKNQAKVIKSTTLYLKEENNNCWLYYDDVLICSSKKGFKKPMDLREFVIYLFPNSTVYFRNEMFLILHEVHWFRNYKTLLKDPQKFSKLAKEIIDKSDSPSAFTKFTFDYWFKTLSNFYK